MYELSDQQLALQELARTFAVKEVRPIAKDLDAEPEASRRFPWSVLERASELGLRTLGLQPADGGAGLDVLTHCLVFEELAYGDVGFATALERTWRLSPLLTLNKASDLTLLSTFQNDRRGLLALAANGSSGGQPIAARRQDDGWLLDGDCSGIVAGGIARLFLVEAAEADGRASIFAVGADGPGFRVTRVIDKTGRRLEPMADITLQDCLVKSSRLIGEAGQGPTIVGQLARRYAAATAIGAVAVARAAKDLAVDWALRRIQGGKPIAEHPAVAMKMGDMFVNLEASRSLALRAAWAADHDPQSAEALGLAAKVLSAQAANRVCYDAMQIWGGMGFMREGGLEKFTRDAVGYSTEGAIDACRERLGHLMP